MSDATEVEPVVGQGPGGTLAETEAHTLLAASSGMIMQTFVAGYTPLAWAQKQAQHPDAEEVAVGA